jgi:hypothetical protein
MSVKNVTLSINSAMSPINRMVEKTNDFERVRMYLKQSDMYAVDNQNNMVIEEILINNLCMSCG